MASGTLGCLERGKALSVRRARRLKFRIRSRNIAAFSTREGGRLRVSEPNAAGNETEGRKAGEVELSRKPTKSFVGG